MPFPHTPTHRHTRLLHTLQKTLTRSLRLEDPRTVVPAIDHMINRSGVFNADFSGHLKQGSSAQTLTAKSTALNKKTWKIGLTPSAWPPRAFFAPRRELASVAGAMEAPLAFYAKRQRGAKRSSRRGRPDTRPRAAPAAPAPAPPPADLPAGRTTAHYVVSCGPVCELCEQSGVGAKRRANAA